MASGPLGNFFEALKPLFTYFFTKDTERLTAFETAKFFAYKSLLFFLVCIVLPAVLYNLYFIILYNMINAACTYASGNLNSFLLSFTGPAAWFAEKCRFPEAFSIFMDALTIRVVFRFLRIV